MTSCGGQGWGQEGREQLGLAARPKWRKMGLNPTSHHEQVGWSLLRDQGTLSHRNEGQCDPAPKSGRALGSVSLHRAGSGSLLNISPMGWAPSSSAGGILFLWCGKGDF